MVGVPLSTPVELSESQDGKEPAGAQVSEALDPLTVIGCRYGVLTTAFASVVLTVNGRTDKAKVRDPDMEGSEAVRVTEAGLAMVAATAVKVADGAPDGTVTVEGTETAGPSDRSEMVTPDAGAGAESATVQIDCAPEATFDGAQLKDARPAAG